MLADWLLLPFKFVKFSDGGFTERNHTQTHANLNTFNLMTRKTDTPTHQHNINKDRNITNSHRTSVCCPGRCSVYNVAYFVLWQTASKKQSEQLKKKSNEIMAKTSTKKSIQKYWKISQKSQTFLLNPTKRQQCIPRSKKKLFAGYFWKYIANSEYLQNRATMRIKFGINSEFR